MGSAGAASRFNCKPNLIFHFQSNTFHVNRKQNVAPTAAPTTHTRILAGHDSMCILFEASDSNLLWNILRKSLTD